MTLVLCLYTGAYTVVHRVSAHVRLLLEAEKSGGGRLHT